MKLTTSEYRLVRNMNRRDFIWALTASAMGSWTVGVRRVFANTNADMPTMPENQPATKIRRYKIDKTTIEKDACPAPLDLKVHIRDNQSKPADQSACLAPLQNQSPKLQAFEYKKKMEAFNSPHPEDQYVPENQRKLLKSCVKRLDRVYRTVGHANFYLLGVDEAIKLSKGYQRIGRFTKPEIHFLESLFHQNAVTYGFYGKKQISAFTHKIPKSKVQRIPGSANYLFKGQPTELYQRLKNDIGVKAILTSGIRGIIKQSHLFLTKAFSNNGNLSLASRSIAPPGYSYHGVGDFDVGQVGFGHDNFSARFIQSNVFRRLHDLNYICLRYTEDNPFGVRFEPWHVMVGLSG